MLDTAAEMFIAVVGAGVAAVGGTCALLIRHMNSDARALESVRKAVTDLQAKVTSDLADYKLIAADKFVSVAHLQEVEGRLVKHLDKIEALVERALRIGETSERPR